MDRRGIASRYYLKLSAFDKMPHQRLLLKLKAHGIGDGIDWIEQWLTDRRQHAVVDGEVSNRKSVLNGIPRGSVLRPLLFLIYINGLDDNITSNILKFADDTKVFKKVNTDGDKKKLQNDLDRLVKWSENGRCCSILENVNAYIQDMGTWMKV